MFAVTDRISDLLSALVETGATPGAVVVAGTHETVLAECVAGRLSRAADAGPVTPDTIYDLASLTKVIVTTPLVMRLQEAGQLDLDAPVRRYVPEFAGGARDRVTLADLLAHCGGLPWWADLYRQARGLPTADVMGFYIRRICELPLNYQPRTRTVYSDLGFILLGAVLENVTGAPLDRLAEDEVFAPLGMRDIRYNPPAALRSRIAPTEDDPERGGVLTGLVHDENASGLGGVAPHAGLFATARSLVPFAQMWLAKGATGNSRVFDRATVRRFSRRARLADDSSRALGWDTPTPDSSCGNCFSRASYGHTGFTGTSLWIDPEQDLFVILLSNRVHPTRDNTRLAELRPEFHDALVDVLT
ncbi:MAG: beta-lactamase family protein [Proteobacteria bacterium]|nr:beta-lactamase family protein [Pseudomonadota bacterium]MYJ96047.1 beta-lactamase family protein [Pseudomonadota bacterium]